MKTPSLLPFRFITGLILIALTTTCYLWFKDINPLDIKVINSIILVAIAYSLSSLSINKLLQFPGKQSWLNILPTIGMAYSATFGVFALFFITFSNSFVLFNSIITTLFFSLNHYWRSQHQPHIAFIPLGRASETQHIPQVNWLRLDSPSLPNTPIQAIVTDLHSPQLNASWQKFLAQCTLQNLPVYHIRQIEESLTGRVKIQHMYENDLGSLLPSASYMLIKRLLDITLILLSLPLTLPLMLLTALAIYIDNPGSILFTQKRVGQGGRQFTIYKFRSMHHNSEQNGAQLAQPNDQRITKVGHIIRKTRLDELPQFFNILKGDMSLIGPRPEQQALVHQFEQRIPFYNYRHIVKPGLSGWAQVMHGYASNTQETQIKIEHDFYYIKHFSLSLDILILFKTLKTILTGFGAR